MSKKKQPAAIYMNIDDLYPAPDNPRVNDHVVDKVVRSIQLHGFAAPIVANLQGEILAGHTRWKAAKKIGMTTIPVRQMDLTGDQARLYRIADNKLSEFADWDEDMLREQLADLEKAFPVDVADLFTDDELEQLLVDKEDFQLEDTYEAPDEIETNIKLGDIIEIGKHRLICSDSTDPESYTKLMNSKLADISFTSPPYNVSKTPTEISSNKKSKYLNDSDRKTKEDYQLFLNEITKHNLNNSNYFVMNIQMLASNKINIISLLDKYKNNFIDVVIWDKMFGQPAMAKSVFNSCFEFLFFLKKESNPSRSIPGSSFRGTIDNIFRLQPQRSNEFAKLHSATFPIDLVCFVLGLAKNKSILLDSFLGTGTSMVACHQNNHICYGIEIDPIYCQIIINRMLTLDPKLEVKINGVRYE